MAAASGLETGVPPPLLAAVAYQESSWDTDPPKGARWIDELGIMQIRPATARDLGYTGPLAALVYDPALSFHLAALYLSRLRNQFGGWAAAVSSYNAGHPTGANLETYVRPVMERAGFWAKSRGGIASLAGVVTLLAVLFGLSRWKTSRPS